MARDGDRPRSGAPGRPARIRDGAHPAKKPYFAKGKGEASNRFPRKPLSGKPPSGKPSRDPDDARRGQSDRSPPPSSDPGWRSQGNTQDPARTPRPDDDLIRVAGLPSVLELFETGPERVERLYFEAEMRPHVQEHCAYLGRRHKVYRQIKDEEMRRVSGTAMHGGIVALARPRPIRDLDLADVRKWAAAGAPLLILDGIGNPQNIGAIARTAAFFGVPRLVLSGHPGQSGLSDAAYRIAKGGLERIDIYRANRLPEVLKALAEHYDVVGTALGGDKSLQSIGKGERPVALVLGNEEDGLSPATLAACTYVVTLQGGGRVQSLNVGAAAAILVHALLGRSG